MGVRWVRDLLLLAGLYFAAAKLGLSLATVHASASAVWPPTGIALAAILVHGYRLWPGITLGSFLANLVTAGNVATSLGIATGNTLEAVLGAYLVRRYASTPRVLAGSKNVYAFLVLAALASTTVSSTIGVTSLSLGRYASWPEFGAIWTTWWLGDAAGALVVAPPLLLWSQNPSLRATRRQSLHAAALALITVATATVVFWGTLPIGKNAPLSFLCIPVLIWAALGFGARGAATITLLLSACAVAGTVRNLGPFGLESPNRSLPFLQAFMGVISVLGLTLAAFVSEARQGREALQAAYGALEHRVAERTAELSAAVNSLHAEVLEHEATQKRLRESEGNLAMAQALAHLGSWRWDIPRNRVHWSDELYRIFGLEPRAVPITYESFIVRVHEEDREFVAATIRRSYETGEPFGFEHRIVLPDGSVRWLQGLGEVLRHGGTAVEMHGTSHDITRHKLGDMERSRLEQELIDVSHREQQRLGQDLHDDLGQLLTGIAFLAKTVEQKLAACQRPEAAALAEIRSLVNTAIAKTRILARGLAAATVAEEGLVSALRELSSNTAKLFGVSCRFEQLGDHQNAPSWAEVHQYRIVQEAISNAIRHGKADRISIILSANEKGTTLSVQDNGVGFKNDGEASGGLGLRIMKYRAGLIGGTIHIESTAAGSRVSCHLPRSAASRGRRDGAA